MVHEGQPPSTTTSGRASWRPTRRRRPESFPTGSRPPRARSRSPSCSTSSRATCSAATRAPIAADPLARAVAERALARGFDRQVPPPDRQFFYLPFEHSEALADQERCCALFARGRRRRPAEMGANCTPTSSAGSAASRTATPCSAAPPRPRSRPSSTAAASRVRPKSAAAEHWTLPQNRPLIAGARFQETVHVVAGPKVLPWLC